MVMFSMLMLIVVAALVLAVRRRHGAWILTALPAGLLGRPARQHGEPLRRPGPTDPEKTGCLRLGQIPHHTGNAQRPARLQVHQVTGLAHP